MDLSNIKSRVFKTYITYFFSLDDKIKLWNYYCDENDSTEDYVFMNDYQSLINNEILDSITAGELLRMAFYGKYDYSDTFCYFNDQGYLASASFIGKTPYDANKLTEYVLDNIDKYKQKFDVIDIVESIMIVGDDMFSAENNDIEDYIHESYDLDMECLLYNDFDYEKLFTGIINKFPRR